MNVKLRVLREIRVFLRAHNGMSEIRNPNPPPEMLPLADQTGSCIGADRDHSYKEVCGIK